MRKAVLLAFFISRSISSRNGKSKEKLYNVSVNRIQTNDVPAGGQSGSVNNLSCNKAVGKKKNKEELQYGKNQLPPPHPHTHTNKQTPQNVITLRLF